MIYVLHVFGKLIPQGDIFCVYFCWFIPQEYCVFGRFLHQVYICFVCLVNLFLKDAYAACIWLSYSSWIYMLSVLGYIYSSSMYVLCVFGRFKSKKQIESEINGDWYGLVEGKGTNAIHILRTLLEGITEIKTNLYLSFINYIKEFDSVEPEKIIRIPKQLNIDGKDL